MSESASSTNGAFVPTRTIYDKVLELEKSVVKLNTLVAVVGLIVGPLTSSVISVLVMSTIGVN